MNNITFSQHTYKTYKSIKLTSYLNDNDLVDKRQIAFRKYLNTVIMLSLFDDLYAVHSTHSVPKSTPHPLQIHSKSNPNPLQIHISHHNNYSASNILLRPSHITHHVSLHHSRTTPTNCLCHPLAPCSADITPDCNDARFSYRLRVSQPLLVDPDGHLGDAAGNLAPQLVYCDVTSYYHVGITVMIHDR